MALLDNMNHEQWADIYKKLVYWELQLEQVDNRDMSDILESQKVDANTNFCRFIRKNYESWLNNPNVSRPMLSHQLMKKVVFPELSSSQSTFVIIIDNLRYDQWKTIEPIVSELFNIDKEETYYSILPTTTAYARNAIFSGMLPSEMVKAHPDLWVGEEDDEGKNNFEDEFLARQLKRNNLNIKFSYNKIKQLEEGRDLADSINNLFGNALNVIVYNFVDMLSHARTDMAMIRELAPDEAAYRSITKSWFIHSPLFEILKKISEKKMKVIITTDHGTIRVKRPFKIVGDKNVNSNLRYKQGKNLGYEGDKLLEAPKPERFFCQNKMFPPAMCSPLRISFSLIPTTIITM